MSLCVEVVGNCLALLSVDVGYDDACAVLGQLARDGLADALTGAGDNGDFIFKKLHNVCLSVNLFAYFANRGKLCLPSTLITS